MKKDMDILELEGMEFWARHGCLPHEKESENLFVVDFRAETDMTAAAESDRIEDTVDYGRIYRPAGILRKGIQTQTSRERSGGMVQSHIGPYREINIFRLE